jgi:hypothetical protein
MGDIDPAALKSLIARMTGIWTGSKGHTVIMAPPEGMTTEEFCKAYNEANPECHAEPYVWEDDDD